MAAITGLNPYQLTLARAYQRVRIGIGHPGQKDKVLTHVLKDFSRGEEQWLHPLLDEMARAAILLVGGAKI